MKIRTAAKALFQLIAGILIAVLSVYVHQHRFPSDITVAAADGTVLHVSWLWDTTVTYALLFILLISLLGVIVSVFGLVNLFASVTARQSPATEIRPKAWASITDAVQLVVGSVVGGLCLYIAVLPYPADVVKPQLDGTLEVLYLFPDSAINSAINVTYVIAALGIAVAASGLCNLLWQAPLIQQKKREC
ncbi:hypothetical protein [Dehalogenimonas alkenigignens]|uniref:Uncharacterized protein n=1 Tax=Dehalogenimonas alkenigignens TaxID=1217799 RepID=A0A0W0GGW3_9CHLR|nr:hypothetical protein [Dehalogenimonas alkenigignens]KTB47798.1 hypothetical protein DEALK_06430 [Dehalogenimonas alkenigignens]PVV83945.1 hypothetical protein DD509_04520 [Dehalogenimonas alkenigignens]